MCVCVCVHVYVCVCVCVCVKEEAVEVMDVHMYAYPDMFFGCMILCMKVCILFLR